MKFRTRIRGPKLRFKLMFLSTALLAVPWLSYMQLIEMEKLLIQGQQNAQLLVARAISSVLRNRQDLFEDLALPIEEYKSLYAQPLHSAVRIDGDNSDWDSDTDIVLHSFKPAAVNENNQVADGAFNLALGERNEFLFVFVKIMDNRRIYRDLGYLRLDTADHLRLSYIDNSGILGRIALTYSKPGVITAYQMDEEWNYAEIGAPVHDLRGFVVETQDGFAIEFRCPLSMLGSSRNFGISFVDVDDEQTREVREIIQTLPSPGRGSFNLVIVRNKDLTQIIEGLRSADTRILVVDTQQRVRAEVGSYSTANSTSAQNSPTFDIRRGFEWFRPILHYLVVGEAWSEMSIEESDQLATEAINTALNGEPIAVRRRADEGGQIIMAAYPIDSGETVLGAISVERNIEQILSFQRSALERIAFVSLMSFFALIIVVLAFSVRLAYRIGKLRRQTRAAIDEHGRLASTQVRAEIKSGDEIGDLARTIDEMLSRLAQYNSFLIKMPRTLRHEINNPLNALSTSIEHLRNETDPDRQKKYFESARRGVMRIGVIVQNLSDTVSLEEALTNDELERVDLEALISNYVSNCQTAHPTTTFVFRGTNSPAYAYVSDYRIEQMLDKIIDNALDFHRHDTSIKIQLDQLEKFLQITVANRGPTLARSSRELFESMVSHRASGGRLHFGLGLHVVRVIAEYHGGSVRAFNLADGSGVVLAVQIPLTVTNIESSEVNVVAS